MTASQPLAPGPVEERPAGTRWRVALVVCLVLAVVVGGGWWVTRPAGAMATGEGVTPGAPKVGDPAPDFTALDVDGRSVRLSELRGRPVWVTFGASWCAPCRVEAPDIQAAHAAAGDTGVQVVAVYLSEDAATVERFASTLGLTYTHLPDPEQSLADAWGVRGIPVHYFVDASGTLRSIQVGIVGPDRIKTVLAELSGDAG